MNRRELLFSMGLMPWAAASAPQGVQLPADFGAHPEDRTEWWYLTGSLEAAGRTWGFQVTFFRSRTDMAPGHPSRFAAEQLVFGHAALTDLAAGRQVHDQRTARAGFGIAGAAVGRTDLVLRDWRLVRDEAGYQATVDCPAAGFGISLTLAPTQPPLLQGRAGWSQKGPDPAQASRYYSEPQLAVRGTLKQAGRAIAVSGRAWLDHEWGRALMDPAAVGWDWIGMNLDDGSALTAFRMRRADGSALYAGGSFRAAGGAARSFGPADVAFEPGRRWRSPASQASYPVEWQVATPAGRFQVVSLLDAQELDSRASTGAWYWEGISDLRDASGARVGRGYLEMTGYASRLVL